MGKEECKHCGKRFVSLSKLKRHMVGHTGAKPHRCNIPGCAAAYTQRGGLKTHSVKHIPVNRIAAAAAAGEKINGFPITILLQLAMAPRRKARKSTSPGPPRAQGAT